MESQETPSSQNDYKESKVVRLTLPDFITYYKATVRKTEWH